MSATHVEAETELCCRFLEDSEYYKLEELFREHNDEMPDPKLSRIAVVEIRETEEIIGFFCFQLYGHAEPMHIKEEYRHSGLWLKLVEMILPLTERSKTFIIAATKETEEMCIKMGLRKLKSPVYVKDVI